MATFCPCCPSFFLCQCPHLVWQQQHNYCNSVVVASLLSSSLCLLCLGQHPQVNPYPFPYPFPWVHICSRYRYRWLLGYPGGIPVRLSTHTCIRAVAYGPHPSWQWDLPPIAHNLSSGELSIVPHISNSHYFPLCLLLRNHIWRYTIEWCSVLSKFERCPHDIHMWQNGGVNCS